MRDIKFGLENRRGTVKFLAAQTGLIYHDSLIGDEVWERLRDEYVFRCQITTCVRHRETSGEIGVLSARGVTPCLQPVPYSCLLARKTTIHNTTYLRFESCFHFG
jgi:hypothetical protein